MRCALENLDAWRAPVPHKSITPNDTCQVRYQPRGVVLIIGTWNFPNPLVLKPLASAIAAGNTVLLKLSEVCPNVSATHAELLQKYLGPDIVRIVKGGVPQATEVLRQKFDMIFYTGNTAVGKVVMRAAAEHLTPCVLELGGKNPVVVARDADINIAARKIVDGRLKNVGQFCVAPDHVFVEEPVAKELASAMVAAVREFYTEDPKTSASFSRIISERHAARIAGLLNDEHGGDILVGGKYDIADRYVDPTIVYNPDDASRVMNEEIFGPILPVKTVASISDAIERINKRPRSLALYVFTSNDETAQRIVNSTFSGGACVNDVIVHMLNTVLPFGGNGESGMGSYHGVYGFRSFSHEKAVMHVAHGSDRAGYPPFE